MVKLFEMLEGKKTYLFAAAGAGTVALWWLGVVPTELADKILAVCGFGSIASLRASK